MSIRIVREIPEETWRSFVESNPDGNIFHTPEMFQVFSRTKGHEPELWAAIGTHQQILALFLPVRISLKPGVLQYLTSRSVVFGSVLCNQDNEAFEALRILLQSYQRETGLRSLFTQLRNISPSNGYQPVLRKMRFDYEDHLNFLINLKESPTDVFNRIGKRTQRNIKRAINRERVSIEDVVEKSGIFECYDLLQKTYQNAQVPLADRSLFEAAFQQLYPKGMLKIMLARVGGLPAAVSVELLYKDLIYGWYGGTDRAYRAYTPTELLMWHILRWGSENGYRCYDFGGAGRPEEDYGVRNFKAKFGGSLVCYGRNTWVPSPVLLWISNLGYEVYRRFI
jgi:serine/alanine adding enzyme